MSRTISILDHEFTLSTPYEAGQTINEAEANTLNQTRAENIGNNIRKQVKEIKALPDGEEKEKKLSDLRAKVAEYDEKYEFNMASGRSSVSLSPVEKKATKIARGQLRAALKDANLTMAQYTETNGEDYVNGKVAEIAAMPEVVAEAEAQVKEDEARQSRIAKINLDTPADTKGGKKAKAA